MAGDLELGKTYLCNHCRKGTFNIRIDTIDGDWIEGEVREGLAQFLDGGEKITVHRSLCKFASLKPMGEGLMPTSTAAQKRIRPWSRLELQEMLEEACEVISGFLKLLPGAENDAHGTPGGDALARLRDFSRTLSDSRDCWHSNEPWED